MEEKEETVAVRRTTSEQRKLRSRDAARQRRSQETDVFYDLARCLPLPHRVSTHLDKSAIMRASLSFLWMRRLLRPAGEDHKEESEDEEEEDPMDTFYPQALAGFVMVINEEGDMIYLMESVSRYIGITQMELLGQSIYDFVHPCDHEELRDLLTPRPGSSKKLLTEQKSERNFFLRMKSTLTSRGRTINIKSASWKVLHCTGRVRPFGGGSGSPPVMTLLCEPIPHPSSVEFPLDSYTFLTRHSMDLHFTHCEGRVTELVGYKADDLIGRSAYEFYHALDCDHICKSMHTLLSKGQVSTSHYRFLVNKGGFVWAETQATVLYSSKTSKPEAIVCLNFILSDVEQPDAVFSFEQIHCQAEPHSASLAPEDGGNAEICDSDPDSERLSSSSKTEDAALNASSAAELFFKLREKPEELLQLAPEAGDIVPLTDFVELSFLSPSSPDLVPDHPEDLCTPHLRHLLTAIFNPVTPPSSSASSPDPQPSSCEDEEMDTSDVEKFFAVQPEDGQENGETMKGTEGMDLEMFAPYISMDDDFQLTVLSSLPEEADKPSTVTPAVTVSLKRTHDPDKETSSQPTIQDKRQKPNASSTEEELLRHRLLGCLDETDQLDLVPDSGSGVWSRLLTNRDPLLGGIQGLCDTAATMRDIFRPRLPDLSPPLSPMT